MQNLGLKLCAEAAYHVAPFNKENAHRLSLCRANTEFIIIDLHN